VNLAVRQAAELRGGGQPFIDDPRLRVSIPLPTTAFPGGQTVYGVLGPLLMYLSARDKWSLIALRRSRRALPAFGPIQVGRRVGFCAAWAIYNVDRVLNLQGHTKRQ